MLRTNCLLVDGASNSPILSDEAEVGVILSELVKEIGSVALSEPLVVWGTLRPGVTGTVIIEASDITIHTFTDTQRFNLDVFSCERFDPGAVIDFLGRRLAATDLTVHAIDRII